MRKNFSGFAAIALLCTLAGCAAPAYKPLDPAAKASLASTQVDVAIKQHEIYADIYYANGGGGLIGALISSAIENKRAADAEKAIAPLRNSLLDYDFDKVMTADVQASLTKVDWLHAGNVVVSKDSAPDADDKLVSSSDAPDVALLNVDYHLTPSFDQLIVTVRAGLYPKSGVTKIKGGGSLSPADAGKAMTIETLVYRRMVPPHTFGENDDPSDDQLIGYWSQNNGANARAALTDACSEISRLLGLYLGNLPQPATSTKSVSLPDAVRGVSPSSVSGKMLERNGLRVLVRLSNDILVSTDVTEVKGL